MSVTTWYPELVRTGDDVEVASLGLLPAHERRGFRRYDERAGR